MAYQLDFEGINQQLGKKYQMYRRKKVYVLPLPTREPDRAKFEQGFASIIGGVIRKLYGKSTRQDSDVVLNENISEIINFSEQSSEQFFKHFLDKQIESMNHGSIDSIQQFEKISLAKNKNEQKGEIDYINFFYDIFIRGEEEKVKAIFEKVDNSHIINEVLNELSLHNRSTQEKEKQTDRMYRLFFPDFKKQFLQDIDVLTQNSTFFFEKVASLFAHYTVVAISQTILQTNHVSNFKENEFIPVYYILHWEKAAKWRQSYSEGFKRLKDGMRDFYAHEHVLNILAYNTFSDEQNTFYHDYKNMFDDLGPAATQEFIQSIYQWLDTVYETKKRKEAQRYTEEKTLDDAFQDMLSAIQKGVSKEINSRYPMAFEKLITQFFRKHGGSLGSLLSLNREQLLLLIAISVGDKRIKLNELWDEFEKRGVWLDYNSKKEVMNELDKLNYLEKKSDSGDAQYVKTIL